MRRAWIIVILAIVAGLGACVYWVGFSPVDPARYVATLDELAIPPSWQADHTATQRDFIMGSRAIRWFLVDAEPVDSVVTLEDALNANGFVLAPRHVSSDWCDPSPMDSVQISCPPKEVEGCKSPPGGSITCTLRAIRGPDLLYATLSPRGGISQYSYGSVRRQVDPNLSLVVISVEFLR